ncbi:valine--tRNA ligase [bacterium endosymbiont of Pedicinus badii]|uniref:valine--tRNA ligase n=1 Tax=bacterium endosymbiont of Pedicinus badii TaxID=1719126 RepID=UPI0009BA9EE3|nr:valine--tRNA ligase [bacterium endosymbiont of Pedicinus badii]OQM34137.1 hypothetical protein AOQ89_02230 [bacterium endosymbiont of Pedicinus badii]
MKNTYKPSKIEKNIYLFWEKSEIFSPKNQNKKKTNYCILMPPPNITGELHIGHSYQYVLMDFLIRYNKMKGFNTLLQYGIDHAGIATQILIENKIKEKKIKYNRKNLISEILNWKSKIEKIIDNQIRRLGISVDWKRKRFTMDKEFSVSVKKVFIKLYKNRMVYKGRKIVNWDTKLQTAISDLEIYNKKIPIETWYIKYFLAQKNKYKNKNYLTVSTTRPETIFGDVALAVNPEDKRYQKFIGKKVLVPIINRKIPIISDKYAKIEKGTGCVKITPGHDINDYKIAKSHKLNIIGIFKKNGKTLKNLKVFNYLKKKIDKSTDYFIPKEFQELEKNLVRKKILRRLKENDLLEKITTELHSVPHSQKSQTIVEPIVTKQWYIKIKDLSKSAIKIVKKNQINIFPKQYKNMFFKWMENAKDWCISRQIYWGHKIPVWYDKFGNTYFGENEKEVRKKNKINKNSFLYRDRNVLDTWFSSAIWSFSSLGWPSNKSNFLNFHPTKVLITGFDIIFFWVARMIMLTYFILKDENISKVPFKNVYITGLVRDEDGKKMSKSQGNVLNPIDIIDGISLENLIQKKTNNLVFKKNKNKVILKTKKKFPFGIQEHGSDALRFFLISLSSENRDINIDINRILGYKNFCNKLWNASKFVLKHSQKDFKWKKKINFTCIFSIWIIRKLNKTIQKFKKYTKQYRFDLSSRCIYDFFWNKFCNWYLEISKTFLRFGEREEILNTKLILVYVLEKCLRILHPIIPFITEYVWQKIKYTFNCKKQSILEKVFPSERKKIQKYQEKYNFSNIIIKIIKKIRKIQKTSKNTNDSTFIIKIRESSIFEIIKKNKKVIHFMCKTNRIFFKKMKNTKNEEKEYKIAIF